MAHPQQTWTSSVYPPSVLTAEQQLRLEALRLASSRYANGSAGAVRDVADEWAQWLITGNRPDAKEATS